MESKDKILGQYPVMCDNGGRAVYVSFSSAMTAMDKYAKQQAIAFISWAMDNEKIVGNSAGNAFTNQPEEELYSQFIEQQTKDK